jgi:hypothetical protein
MNRIFLFDPCKTRYGSARMALPERILVDSSAARAHLTRKNPGRVIGLMYILFLVVFHRRSRPASQPTHPPAQAAPAACQPR